MVRLPRFSRWWLVLAAVVAMGMTGTYQFVWSSVRVPLGARLGASETALGAVFTLFVVFQTVAQFPAGWVRDRWGPRPPTVAGGLLLAVGYLGTAWAPSVAYVYLFYSLGGVGAGAVYTVAINTPVKWFDERRGLATGLVGLAYAGVSVALIPFVRGGVTETFAGTMVGLAVFVGVLTLVTVPFLRDPGENEGATGESRGDTDDGTSESAGDADHGTGESEDDTDGETGETEGGDARPDGGGYTWRETARTWQFWLLYGVFVVIHGVGLMFIEKVVAYAETMGLPAAGTAGASLVALGSGVGVVAGGSAGDRFGHKRTMVVSLVACGLSFAGGILAAIEGRALAFVVLMGGAAFFRGPAFAVFPSLVGDYYGTGHSSENYALLYSSKLWGGVVGGTVTSALIVRFGWNPTFLFGAGLLVAAGFAIYFLRPVDGG